MITTRNLLGAALLGATLAVAGCGMMPMSKTSSATNQMSGAQEVPPKPGPGAGTASRPSTRKPARCAGPSRTAACRARSTAGHFHGPAAAGANAGVVLPFSGSLASPIEGNATLTEAQMADVVAGRWYANLHTAANPGGEIRGQVTGH